MTHKVEDLELFEDTIKALKLLQDKNVYLVVVTNQSAIAKGIYTEKEMHEFNETLIRLLAKNNIIIDAVYYAPQPAHKGKIDDFKDCYAKPGPLMLLDACNDLGLDSTKCIMIGNQYTDIGAGILAKCKKNLMVKTGIYHTKNENFLFAKEHFKPDKEFTCLYDAIHYVIENDWI